METPVIVVTREQLLEQRTHILKHLRLTLDEWNQKVKNQELRGEEWNYQDELSSIEFLLGEN